MGVVFMGVAQRTWATKMADEAFESQRPGPGPGGRSDTSYTYSSYDGDRG